MTTKSPIGQGPNQIPLNHMLGPLAYARSADSEFAPIASAATVNLNARGTIGHLTGAVTVTAFTLARGECKRLIADGAAVITHNASIIVQGGANYTCAANDILTIEGEGGGVARVTIDRANGRPVIKAASMRVSDRKASGTQAGASVGADITQTRTLNTVDYNAITGASLSGNQVTLAAGTYRYFGRAPANGSGAHKAFLYNVTDAVYTGLGSNAFAAAGNGGDSFVSGEFTITASKSFSIRHFTNAAVASFGLGSATSTGQLEVYAELEFEKVA